MDCLYCNYPVLLAEFPKELRQYYKEPCYHITCLLKFLSKQQSAVKK
jgi:hypothetical protein